MAVAGLLPDPDLSLSPLSAEEAQKILASVSPAVAAELALLAPLFQHPLKNAENCSMISPPVTAL